MYRARRRRRRQHRATAVASAASCLRRPCGLQGEYIAAEKVENALLSAWVQQIFVYGDSFHSTLIAIVIPNPDTAK